MFSFRPDTNTIIDVIKEALYRHCKSSYIAHLCISSISTSELYFGAQNSQNVAKNLMIVDDFISRLSVVDYDTLAGSHYGNIYVELKQQGKLMGKNDMHIAGDARSLGLILVTNKTRKILRVVGLRLANWG